MEQELEKFSVKKYLQNPILKNKNFTKQMMATAISRFGDGIDTIAFSWLTYKITGSTLLVATLFALNGLPNIIFGVWSGILSKYYSKKRIMALCDLGRGICVLTIATLALTNYLNVWHLYLITFLNSSFEAFRSPAATSIVPEIIDNDCLEQGVAINTSSSKAAELIGLAIAPVLIGLLNIEFAIIIDSITFFICSFFVFSLKVSERLDNSKLTFKKYGEDLKNGLKYVIKDNLVLNLCIFGALVNCLTVPFNALQAPFVEEVLKRGADAMSFMNIPLILAMTIGVMFAPKIKNKINGRNLFILGGMLLGTSYCLLVFNTFPNIIINNLLLITESFCIGLGLIFINFPIQIAMYRKVPSEYLSRVASIFNAIVLSTIPITSCIVGAISNFIGIGKIFLLFGGFTIIVFLTQYLNKAIIEFKNI